MPNADDALVHMLQPGEDHDIDHLVTLVNDVYEVSEAGMWGDGAARTNREEMDDLIRRGEIAVADRDGVIVGAVRVQQLGTETGEFGMLVADPAVRGQGVGRRLVQFAERWAEEAGLRTMQLEVLVPREWSHPSKEFLLEWYQRIGYRQVRTGEFDVEYPHLASELATPCRFLIFHKTLPSGSPAPDGA